MEQGAEFRIVDMHCGLKDEGPSEMVHFIDAFVVEQATDAILQMWDGTPDG